MNNEINYSFLPTSKVIRQIVGIPAADILACLMLKNRYWKAEDKLFMYKGNMGFHISLSDIEEETSYRAHTIKKGLSKLKNEGLIISTPQGLGKPNFYSLDENWINEYINGNKGDYDKWRLKVRNKNKPATPINSEIELKQLSRKDSDNFQEGAQTTATKNKITKNKNTNNFTNHINVVEQEFDLMRYSDKLEILIDNVKEDNDDKEQFNFCMELFDFLCEVIPRFKGFNISDKDYGLIKDIGDYCINSSHIAYRILKNAQAIIDNRKESRFGNLFIGLEEVNSNCETLYG